jgi:hypothetical protein
MTLERLFFSEEKKQKTFVSPPARRWRAPELKVFWFFSAEKNGLLPCPR